jgi:hypothetical protein
LESNETEESGLTFVERYVNYAGGLTDAPSAYHEGVALALLSATVNRRLRLRFAHSTLYSNVWVILLGPSSIMRKSTAMNIGLRLLPKDVCRLPQDFSPEALIDELDKSPRALFYRDELGSFLGDLTKDYMSGTKETLCFLFDCPEEYKRALRAKRFHLRELYLTILTGTTVSSFFHRINEHDIHSGFCNRFLYCPATKKRSWAPVRHATEGDVTERASLSESLSNVFERIGQRPEPIELRLNGEAMRIYNDWLRLREEELMRLGEEESDLLSGFHARIADYVPKLSMLLSAEDIANKQTDKATIQPKAIQRAIQTGDRFMKNARLMLRSIAKGRASTRTAKGEHGGLSFSRFI